MIFERALEYHRNGQAISPTARSVEAGQTIINELNEAIELLRSYQKRDRGEMGSMGASHQTDVFLERHTGAPY